MANELPKLVIFASGSKEGGGSGFENLVKQTQGGVLHAQITGVISNHENGGVRQKARRLNVPFAYFAGPWTASAYQAIVRQFQFDSIALSGWLKLVEGLDSRIVYNIHPAVLPEFGGPGMYGHHVHEAVLRLAKEKCFKGKYGYSAVSMHFITPEYDRGPVFFELPVQIKPEDTPEVLGHRVNAAEHAWQPLITNLVAHGKISWDGKNPTSLKVPLGYKHLPWHNGDIFIGRA